MKQQVRLCGLIALICVHTQKIKPAITREMMCLTMHPHCASKATLLMTLCSSIHFPDAKAIETENSGT